MTIKNTRISHGFMTLPGFVTSDGTKFKEQNEAWLHERVWEYSFGKEKLNTKNVGGKVPWKARCFGVDTSETGLFGDEAIITTYKDVRYFNKSLQDRNNDN